MAIILILAFFVTDSDIEVLGAFIGVITVIGYVLVSTWCIVSWHRFVLLEERPKRWFPPLQLGTIFGYWLRGLALGLIFAVLLVPGLMLLVPFADVFGQFGSMAIALVLLVAIAVFCLRLSPILPAVALGRPIKMRTAFEATAPATGSFLMLVLVYAAPQIGMHFLSEYYAETANLFGIFVSLFVFVLFGLINISLLTTIYGHYIEGRSLD